MQHISGVLTVESKVTIEDCYLGKKLKLDVAERFLSETLLDKQVCVHHIDVERFAKECLKLKDEAEASKRKRSCEDNASRDAKRPMVFITLLQSKAPFPFQPNPFISVGSSTGAELWSDGGEKFTTNSTT